ncbi:hypothetical protein JAAARDRAFT_38471 [Jaapia argillacea MUCL 33604]|uniref:DUF6699 domain-containing protein n=1 Tax=Jaapia argillacea MUCL 33604 TaxID=933084 RepID=A0A067PHM6_9AGAM|nr:hypothetical protein JAAARDRAFT_38471 [Jaapia argillacea MUCL 33604]
MPFPGIPPHAVGSRIVVPHQPWIPSPPTTTAQSLNSLPLELASFALDPSINSRDRYFEPDRTQSRADMMDGGQEFRQSRRRWGKFGIVRRLRHLFDPSTNGSDHRSTAPSSSNTNSIDSRRYGRNANLVVDGNDGVRYDDQLSRTIRRNPIPPEAWKEYGYWARPYIRGVGVVRNATPRPPTSDLPIDPVQVFRSLRGPNDSPHPERWIPNLQHPSLPRRPSLWSKPPHPPISSSTTHPPPWECQLNPYLSHTPQGTPCITFDIGQPPYATFFSTTQNLIPLMEGDFAQPATYPFVSLMCISGVADDCANPWPWPIRVHNRRGVTIRDVFDRIYENFREFLQREEYDGMMERRKRLVEERYFKRIKEERRRPRWSGDDEVEGAVSPRDGLTRVDYMLDRTMFRGLEPHPSKDGTWIMFLGTY